MTKRQLEAWHAERRLGIGGSDVADVFSEPPYGCELKLWLEKTGVPPDFATDPQDVALRMERGKALEPIVARRYAKATGHKITRKGESRTHFLHKHMRVNVDRFILRPEGGVLEIKTHNPRVFAQAKQGGVSRGYYLQLQHALYVTGAHWGAFALLQPDSWQFHAYEVQRDEELLRELVDREEAFWVKVQNGPAPAPLPDATDPRCGRCPWQIKCRGKEVPVMETKDGAVLEEDRSLAPLLADYREASQLAKSAGEWLDEVKDKVRDAVGERTAVACNGAKVYYSRAVVSRLSTRLLRERYPQAASECEIATEQRTLRVYV